ncbi:hypothetical protein DN752_03840 [Echinicola strongylocentroti]|uniref:ISXO2-like transposase domain-containing protein n=1 Tax=Echinicola strongylocentroti TaxID=1795355 RepID=A0A2Z4IFW8_9BACT|nr:hypothetical protein DN752_03840 [Echinicola strongylocentroti]
MVATMAESTVLGDLEPGKKDKSCRYFKMKKIEDQKAKTAEKLVRDFIDKEAVLQTDESTTYVNLEDCVDIHIHKYPHRQRGNST